MTEQEHRLLYIDICARLPYGLVVCQSAQYSDSHFAYSIADKWQKEPHDFHIIGIEGKNTLITDRNKEERTYSKGIVSTPITICIDNGLTNQIARPYLRPMSSMTEDERNEYLNVKMQETERVALAEVYRPEAVSEILDWLNAHHFDYRGLIEKGLALEAPDGMYNL